MDHTCARAHTRTHTHKHRHKSYMYTTRKPPHTHTHTPHTHTQLPLTLSLHAEHEVEDGGEEVGEEVAHDVVQLALHRATLHCPPQGREEVGDHRLVLWHRHLMQAGQRDGGPVLSLGGQLGYSICKHKHRRRTP